MVETQAPTRAKGRPRSCLADSAIDTAALELFADEGFERFSIEAVAIRAGVGKATIYRRFANRDELLANAMGQLREDPPELLPGLDFWTALAQLLETIRGAAPDSLKWRIMIRVLSEGERYPQLQAMVNERLIQPRQRGLRELLQRGITEGNIRRDLDIDAAIALLVGPMVWLKMLRLSKDGGSASTESIVQVLRVGLAPASH